MIEKVSEKLVYLLLTLNAHDESEHQDIVEIVFLIAQNDSAFFSVANQIIVKEFDYTGYSCSTLLDLQLMMFGM